MLNCVLLHCRYVRSLSWEVAKNSVEKGKSFKQTRVNSGKENIKEFVNSDGDHINKMERQWRQTKVKLPPFGVKMYHFSSYLAQCMWHHVHKDEDLFESFLYDVKKLYDVPVNI